MLLHSHAEKGIGWKAQIIKTSPKDMPDTLAEDSWLSGSLQKAVDKPSLSPRLSLRPAWQHVCPLIQSHNELWRVVFMVPSQNKHG